MKIDAVANVEGTNVEILGNTGLIEGENIATVKLTKDDKVTEYKITINKSTAAPLMENTRRKYNSRLKKQNKK